MISMNEQQMEIFATTMAVARAAGELPDYEEDKVVFSFTVEELVLLSLGLMLMSCFEPTQLIFGEKISSVMVKLADQIETSESD